MREFAESEIYIKTGPRIGKFRCSTQPFSGLLFDAIDSGNWRRFFITGPTQSGKTTIAFVIPILYHLFEVGETVVVGVPNMDIARDQWRDKILPAIMATRFKNLLPESGSGSQGGKPVAIQFENGAVLRFMCGGGNDKTRASFTARVAVITEVDGMDEAGEASRESDKISQIEARTRAFGERKRIYGECTVSIESGRTWREYNAGTASKIYLRCPRCTGWVTPEREDLRDWQGAETIIEARRRATIYCPNCGEGWTEKDRELAHKSMRLVHRGQNIDSDGVVTGELPGTDTLGYRWNSINNFLIEPGDIGADEWKASRDPDEANAEKEMCQQVWAVPHKPDATLMAPLDAQVLMHRVGTLKRGEVPSDCRWITVGADIGRWLVHWSAIAWKPDGTGYVIDYGRIETGAQELGEQAGVLKALRELRDICKMGWKQGGGMIYPSQVWIDSRYVGSIVSTFARESGNDTYRPILGCGVGPRFQKRYSSPKDKQNEKWVGDEYHIEADTKAGVLRAEINVDHWKSWLHQRLTVPMASSGALVLFNAPPADHMSISKHLTAEHQVEEFEAGKGTIIRWEPIRRDNHWLDSTNYACAAAHFCGVRLVKAATKPLVVHHQRDDSKPFVRPPVKRQGGGWFRR